MSEQQIMAEEMQSPKKVAFANRKYTNEERVKKEEEELEQLIAEQKGEAEQVEEPKEAEPKNAEERSFKKRYGDLRRHQQTKEKEYEDRINALEQQLGEATKAEFKLPKSDDDLDKWASTYPDVAAIVETIAIKKAKEQSADLEKRVQVIDEMRETAAREKAEAELIKIHPDFSDIRDSDDFHEWADEQPKWVQDALYENSDDPASVVRVIDLYKVDKGLTKTAKKAKAKDAASTVTKRTKTQVDVEDANDVIRESEVAKMSDKQFEEHSDEINKAIRSGKFVYDVSGKAR